MFGGTNFSGRQEFEFDDLLTGKSLKMQQFVEQLETNGWALLTFSEEFKKKTRELGNMLEKGFFEVLEPHKKREFAVSEYLGYHEVLGKEEDILKLSPFKEKLTYVTGKTQYAKKLPTSDLKTFITETDELTKKLCTVLASPLFKCDNVSQLSSQIPLLDSDPEKAVALFDVAYYHNEPKKRAGPIYCNVGAHYDPGLLAISWFSSENGLQVYSHVDDKWVDVNYYFNAVVWMGEAASKFNSKIKTGIHRVLYAENDRESFKKKNSRLSFWTEACIKEQLDFGNLAFTGGIRPDLDKDLSEAVGFYTLTEDEQGSVVGLHLERLTGVPSIKSGSIPSGECFHCGKKGQHHYKHGRGHQLKAKCGECKSGYIIVGEDKSSASYKNMDAVYCDKQCAINDWPKHKDLCNKMHLQYKYHSK